MRTTTGTDFDLDASAIATGADKKVVSDQHFIFFNNMKSPDGSIEHTGDNKTGEGEGDDEVINVDLAAVPANIESIFFPVSIYDGDARSQSFGQVRNAYIRVVDRANGTELARYDLSEDASTETAMVFGELYRNGAEWKFRAIGQGYASVCRVSPATTASTSKNHPDRSGPGLRCRGPDPHLSYCSNHPAKT